LRDNYYKNIENTCESLTIVLDATYLTISGKGTYIEDKWKKELKEYLTTYCS